MYLLSSMACLYRPLRNDHIWFLYQFESSVTKSDVCFLRSCSGGFSLVDEIFSVTVSIHRAQVVVCRNCSSSFNCWCVWLS